MFLNIIFNLSEIFMNDFKTKIYIRIINHSKKDLFFQYRILKNSFDYVILL